MGLASFALLAVPGFLFAQSTEPEEQPTTTDRPSGWRRANEPAPTPAATTHPEAVPRDEFGQPLRGAARRMEPLPEEKPVPAQLILKRGTYVTVRVDQPLSSDRNQQGDAFTATLVKPVVVDGVVVADRGQTLSGRVEEAVKAGRVKGVSRLAVQLTDLSLVDGEQVPIQTQFIGRSGPTTEGRDAGAIASTTAVGAAIGAAADWGRGAAIGAGVGAAAGVVGVLLTRGHETVIFPESVLTFRIETPVTISTERAPHAFRWVSREDYDQPQQQLARRPSLVNRDCGPYGCVPPRYYYGPAYYPYYYGPSFGIYFGRGYYGHRHWRGHRW